MARFILTAQLQLQAPNNVAQVVRQIQSQLNNVNVNVQVRNSQQAQRQLQQVTQSTNQATSAADRMGKAFAMSIRRFAAFSIATRAVGLFTSTLSDAIGTAINFERQLIKISQVTGESMGQLKKLTSTITTLSTSWGVASNDLLNVSTLLLQAGLSSKDTEVALTSLAKAALAPNFDSISQTAEGAIAILAQFQQGVGALEGQLGSINAVAGAFAVEAGDLIDVIRRTGGVFKSSGGSLNELLALFTSVRATTRESAESISTGLRTIFTRIQRPETIEYLKQFGVELVDIEGKFVGPYEAVRRLSAALSGLGERDITFISIAEELGGFRQIGKVLPLLQQFSTAEAALGVAMKSTNTLSADAATAQLALAIRITKVKEEFLALVRSMTETATFQIMANTALALASALIKIGESIKPILPMLAALAAFKMAKGLGTFIGSVATGLTSGRTMHSGGKVHAFATGGLVPGSGNGDTVPAMLTPGEFVIRKSSVNSIGASNLSGMNKYAAGGLVVGNRHGYGTYSNNSSAMNAVRNKMGKTEFNALSDDEKQKRAAESVQAKSLSKTSRDRSLKTATLNNGVVTGLFMQRGSGGSGGIKKILKGEEIDGFKGVKQVLGDPTLGILRQKPKDSLSAEIRPAIEKAVERAAAATMLSLSIPPLDIDESKAAKTAVGRVDINSIEGHIFEAFTSALTGAPLSEAGAGFDIVNPSTQARDRMKKLFEFGNKPIGSSKLFELKRTLSTDTMRSGENSITNKIITSMRNGTLKPENFNIGPSLSQDSTRRNKAKTLNLGGLIQKFAMGGRAESTQGAPLIDDILSNSPNAILPTPQLAIQKLIKSGGGFVDIDRTLKRTIGDQAYARARTPKEQQAVLNKYFLNSRTRLDDIKNAGTTTFGKELQSSIKSGQLSGSSIRVISKSPNTPGVAEYLSGIFGIPSRNFAFTGGKSKVPLMRKFATGGGVGTDTVPALLTPGEFVVNKASAQRIGYGSLNRMNKVGRYASGGVVQHFSTGTRGRGVTAPSSGVSSPSSSLDAFDKFFGAVGNNTEAVNTNSTAQKNLSKSAVEVVNNNKMFALSVGASLMQGFLPAIDDNSSAMLRMGNSLLGLVTTIASVGFALETFNVQLSSGSVFKFLTGQGLNLDKLQNNLLGAGVGKGLTNSLISIAQVLSKFAGPVVAATGLFYALNTAGKLLVESFNNYEGRIKKLTESGQVEQSRKLAEESQSANNKVTKASGAATGAVVGTAVGAGIAAVTFNPYAVMGLSVAGAAIGSVIGSFSDSLSDTSEYFGQIMATQASFIQSQKSLTKTTEDVTKSLEDLNKGNISSTDLLKSLSPATANIEKFRQQSETSNKQGNKEISREGDFAGLRGGLRNVITLGGLLGESTGEKQTRIQSDQNKASQSVAKQEQELVRVAQPALSAFSRQIVMSGGSFEDLMKQIREVDPNLFNILLRQGTNDLNQSFQNIAKEVAITKAKFEAINLGFRSVTSASDAAALKIDNLMNSFEVGNTPASRAASVLEAAMTEAGQNISKVDFDSSLDEVNNLFKSFGASQKQIDKFNGLAQGVAGVQRNFPDIVDTLKQRLQAGGLKDINNPTKVGDEVKKIIGEQLGKSNIAPAVQKQIVDAMGDVKLEQEDIDKLFGPEPDYSVLTKYLGDAGKEAQEVMKAVVDNYAKMNQQVIELTKQRIESERNLVAAQQEAIALYLEGREVQAKYGGPAVSATEQKNAILANSNVESNRLGLTSMKTGSIDELRKRNLEIRQASAGIELRRRDKNGLGVGGPAVTADEKSKDLESARKTEIDTIRKLIKAEEDALKIIQEKSSLEKKSLESLMSGDIEAFFEQQAAVGAQAAIATGDQNLISAYGGKAIAGAAAETKRQQDAGVQTLYGQQLAGPGGMVERGYGAALGARGVTNPLMAQVMAGTTPEEEASKQRLRDLGGVLSESGQMGVEMAQMKVNTAEIRVAQGSVVMANMATGGAEPQGKALGGLVYANRGMFVPRGTDTIPAMLTPGEFVVNRAAVNRDNNLQILSAMNSGGNRSEGGTSSGTQNLSRGGPVQYLKEGSKGGGIMGAIMGGGSDLFAELAKSLTTFASAMASNIKDLQNLKFKITLDTTTVNVNLTGTSFLSGLRESIRADLLQHVGQEIAQYKVGSGGSLVKNTSTLNNYAGLS